MRYFEVFKQYIDCIDERLQSNGKFDLFYRIKHDDIDLIAYLPPAMCSSKVDSSEHTILVDLQFLKSNNYDLGEICAILLHELGHIINFPIDGLVPTDEMQEYYADDYVRYYGFEEELLSSYEKLQQYNLETSGKRNELMDLKIDRIKDGKHINIGQKRKNK